MQSLFSNTVYRRTRVSPRCVRVVYVSFYPPPPPAETVQCGIPPSKYTITRYVCDPVDACTPAALHETSNPRPKHARTRPRRVRLRVSIENLENLSLSLPLALPRF